MILTNLFIFLGLIGASGVVMFAVVALRHSWLYRVGLMHPSEQEERAKILIYSLAKMDKRVDHLVSIMYFYDITVRVVVALLFVIVSLSAYIAFS